MKQESWHDGYDQRDLENFQHQYLNAHIISLMQKFIKVSSELLTLQRGSHKQSKSANKTATNPKRLVLSTKHLQIIKWILCQAASQGLFHLLNQCFTLLFSCRFNLLEVHMQCSILQLICRNEQLDNTDAKNEA